MGNLVLRRRAKLTLADRARSYSVAFPKYPPLAVTERWLYGVWTIGNYYKRAVGYYGEYPPSYMRRVLSLFPEIRPEQRLHAFSGVVNDPGSTRVDVNSSLGPDVVSRIESMPFHSNVFSLALADPPYTSEDAKRYGTKMPNRGACVKELARVVRPGGFVVWLDQMPPMYRKDTVKRVGSIMLEVGTNRRVRIVSIFEVL